MRSSPIPVHSALTCTERLGLQPSINKTAGRLFSVDILKAISITAVVSFHSLFVPSSTYAPASHLIEVLFAPLRFCVPVLLTISFLLLARGLEISSTDETIYPLLKKRLIRLTIPIVFWFSIAAVAMRLLDRTSLAQLITLMFQGYIFRGAYYLLILLQFVPVVIWLNRWVIRRKYVLIAVGFQCLVSLLIYISLSGAFGAHVPLFLQLIGRPLFVYWFVYLALGMYFYNNWFMLVKISTRIPTPLKIFLLSLTCLIMAVEYRWLLSLTHNRIVPFEYVMLSCILSVVTVFLCFASIQESQLSIPVINSVRLLSRYSLGIYCINGILSYVLTEVGSNLLKEAIFSFPEILVMKFMGWALLLTVSLGLSILFDRLGLGASVC